jgi:type IV secretory pathway TrbF-like protein
MENTANGILAGLGTMLIAVAVVSVMVWLADRS